MYPPKVIDAKWMKFPPLSSPLRVNEAAFMLNDNQFIVPQQETINTYDLTLNTWSKKTFPELSQGDIDHTFDLNTQCLYTYTYNFNSKVSKLNLNTDEITHNNLQNDQHAVNPTNCVTIKLGSQHHFIAGYHHPKHEIWDENEPLKHVELMHDFDDEPHEFELQQSRGIYIESKGEILIFGGCSTNINKTFSDTIWRYTINENKWDLLECKMPIKTFGFGCVMTTDEKYVIIFDGYSENNPRGKEDGIYVLNMKQMEWKKCKLKCPIAKGCYGLIVPGKRDEDNVVYAFIRFVCDGIEVDHIPFDIIKLIDTMYSECERVHLFIRNYNQHYAINVNDILFNC